MMPLLALLPSIIDVAKTVIDRTVPDKEAAAKAKRELESAEVQQEFTLMIEQIKVNQEEAKSQNWLVAGWRPFVGWVCGLALAYVGLIEPFARFAAKVWFGYSGAFPVIDTSLTMQILIAMLGFGGLRSFEKHKGMAR